MIVSLKLPSLLLPLDSLLQVIECNNFMLHCNTAFSGSVTPPLPGVTIKLEAAALNPTEVTVETDGKGAYSLGPFPRDLKYTVVAERLGYVLAPLDGKPGSFSAKKLASVVVRMVDEQGAALPGVLVSLSGIFYPIFFHFE